jgi:hypothetical protein
VVAAPVKLLTVALLSDRSELVNPVTASENVTVTETDPREVGEEVVVDSDTVGATESNVREKTDDAVLVFPAPSWAAADEAWALKVP